MKNVIINQHNVVALIGRTNNKPTVALPFFLKDISQLDVDVSILCPIDLAESLTSLLRFVCEPGYILKHKSGTYEVHKVHRHFFNSIPLLVAVTISQYGVSRNEITTACIQLTDFDTCSVKTAHNMYRGISLGHIICPGKKHSPIILANGLKEVNFHENHG